VSSVAVTANGSGYIGRPVVYLTGGDGSGATAVADFNPATGEVTGVTITNPGTGYTTAPSVTFSGGGGSEPTLGTVTLAPNTSGGLTKSGAGTLSLTAANSYTGDTTVSEGTLSLGDATNNTALADTAKVFIATGATVNLNYLVGNTDTVKELWLGGVQKPAGVYSSSDPSGLITGSGTLTVTTSPAPADPFAAWIGGPPYNLTGPNAAFDFDYDNDGIDNGLEWILGGNPTQNDNPSVLPVTTGSATTGLTLVFNRATASLPPASTLVVDFDSDLDATWTKSVTVGAANSGPDANGVIVTVDTPSVGKVTVTIPASNAVAGKLFARLRAVKP
jgi:autotransporter-associated beta strand protein